MDNRIIIFEDNQVDWSCIKSMLESGGLKNYYPVTDKEFRELKNYLQEFDSSISLNKAKARSFISKTIKESDFLLMDYVLKIDDVNINCIRIYIDLKLNNKALIYTAQISRHYVLIENEVNENILTHNIKVVMKPDLEATCEIKEDIDFLCDNIKKANGLSSSIENTCFDRPPGIKPE